MPARISLLPQQKHQKTHCNNDGQLAPCPKFFSGGPAPMLIGYVRVSKNDGTQTLAPQRDALLATGVELERIYEDLASGPA